MSVTMTRMQCLDLSAQLHRKFSSLKVGRDDLAEVLANFAIEAGETGIEPRMTALAAAIRFANTRGNLEDVMNYARNIVAFAEKRPAPKPEPKPQQPKPAQSRNRGRGRTSR